MIEDSNYVKPSFSCRAIAPLKEDGKTPDLDKMSSLTTMLVVTSPATIYEYLKLRHKKENK